MLALGCASPPKPAPVTTAPPAHEDPAGPRFSLTPSVEAASTYGARVDETPSAEEGEILGLVESAARAAGVPPPRWEGRLARLARDLARAVSDDGPPPGAVVDFLGWHHGRVEPSPHLIVVDAPLPRPAASDRATEEQVRRVLSEGDGRYAQVGVGTAGRRFLIALGESHVALDPLPRALLSGGRVEVRARVLPPFSSGNGFVQSPDGRTRPLVHEGDTLRATIVCEGEQGRHQVEVTGQDRFGVAVLANFPIWCGVDPPATIAWAPATLPPGSAEEAEAAILLLVQHDRRSAGLPELRPDARLRALARAHSHDMRDKRFVGHVSPGRGGPADRARRSGLAVAVLLENVARAYSPEDIQTGLMDSPGHRKNILDPRVTQLGVGVALGPRVGQRRELWVTQTFARYE